MVRGFIALVAFVMVAACGTIRFVEDIYATEDAAYFASRIKVEDDQVEGYRFASSAAIGRSPPIDAHVYATERAGAVTVTLQVKTITGQWVYPETLYIGTPSRVAKLVRIDSDVTCSSSGACTHFERVAAVLGLDDLRALLSKDQTDFMQARVVGRTGLRVDGYMRKVEIEETLRALGVLDRFTKP